MFRRKTNKIKRKFRQREAPTIDSKKEADDERRNEELQQADIDREKDDLKKDLGDVREYARNKLMESKLSELVKQLPRDDRLRSLIDEDRESILSHQDTKIGIKKK
jgi:hypothetical protein